MYLPIVMYAVLLCGKLSREDIAYPYSLVLKTPFKRILDAINERRAEANILRGDIEIYVGLYLLIGWFFSLSILLQILLYWQVLRIRYMLNDEIKAAFGRFDGNV